jgi:hypothetical protein
MPRVGLKAAVTNLGSAKLFCYGFCGAPVSQLTLVGRGEPGRRAPAGGSMAGIVFSPLAVPASPLVLGPHMMAGGVIDGP